MRHDFCLLVAFSHVFSFFHDIQRPHAALSLLARHFCCTARTSSAIPAAHSSEWPLGQNMRFCGVARKSARGLPIHRATTMVTESSGQAPLCAIFIFSIFFKSPQKSPQYSQDTSGLALVLHHYVSNEHAGCCHG